MLCPVDARGNLLEEQAASTLTFENAGSVAVRSDVPVRYWLINGIRIEPVESVTGFVLKNIMTDLSISGMLLHLPQRRSQFCHQRHRSVRRDNYCLYG